MLGAIWCCSLGLPSPRSSLATWRRSGTGNPSQPSFTRADFIKWMFTSRRSGATTGVHHGRRPRGSASAQKSTAVSPDLKQRCSGYRLASHLLPRASFPDWLLCQPDASPEDRVLCRTKARSPLVSPARRPRTATPSDGYVSSVTAVIFSQASPPHISTVCVLRTHQSQWRRVRQSQPTPPGLDAVIPSRHGQVLAKSNSPLVRRGPSRI